jgi:peptidoglycan/LPS O-acetylase OafA/YrhL
VLSRSTLIISPNRERGLHYRDEIDGLRAIAISSVILFHSGVSLFSGGYAGVDIFFVISGYLITKIVAGEIEEGRFTFVAFYARRARRILPALFFMAAIVSAVCLVLLLPPDLYKYGKILVFTIVFGANFRLAAERAYFDEDTRDNPLLHMWSLSVEEQFYLVWPVLLLLIVRMRSLKGAAVLGLFFASFAVSAALVHWMPRSAFYHLPSRGWELLTGAALALGLVPQFGTRRIAEAACWAGLGMMAISVFLFDAGTPFPGFAALLPTFGCALVIHATTRRPLAAGRLLSLGPVVYLGKISYSLYLWHWPLIAIPSYVLMRKLSGPETAAAIALSVALAAFSLRFVERPFRKPQPAVLPVSGASRLLAPIRNPRVLQGVAAAAMLIACGSYFQSSAGASWRLSPEALAIAGQKRDFQLVTFCGSYKKSESNFYECSWGKPERRGELPAILWGDSHADHYLPGIVEVFGSGKFLMTPSCPPVALPDRSPGFAKLIQNCAGNNAKALRTILAERPAVVVLAGVWSRVTNAPELADFLKAMTQMLARNGSKVLILGEAPPQSPQSLRCEGIRLYLGLPNLDCGRIERAKIGANYEATEAVLASAQNRDVAYYSPIDLFCDRAYCYASSNGRWLYADGHHLNAEGGRLTAATIRAAVSALKGETISAGARQKPDDAPQRN